MTDEQSTNLHLPSADTSCWEDTTVLSPADYLIVGAGITGINAAISIKAHAPAARVIVLDRGSWGEGASFRNAGFACLGSPTELLADLQDGQDDLVWHLVEMRHRGLQQLIRRVRPGAMELSRCGGTEFFSRDEPDLWEQTLDQLSMLDHHLKQITGRKEPHFFPTQSEGGFRNGFGQILIADEARIHPGKMMMRLHEMARSLGVMILGGVAITGWTDTGSGIDVQTSTGHVWHTRRLGLATNGFTRRLMPELEVVPARNQVFLTQPIKGIVWDRCFHAHQGYIYARRVGEQLLIGGARHIDPIGETTDVPGTTSEIETYLLDYLNRHFPVPEGTCFVKRWSGTLGVGSKKIPIICEVGQNIFAAVRLGGMGVAIGTLVGEQLSEMMLNS